jgi:4-hydroxy-2-oxoheptanedioate aldolase
VPGDLTAPTYLNALERVHTAATDHGMACGLLVPDGAAAAAKWAQGWTFLAVGSDATLLAAALAAEIGRAQPQN